MFADIVDSTRLASTLDLEDWVDIVNEAFALMIKAIQRYDGIVLRLLGDAVVAFWGAPLTREDDAERAVRAALDMQGEVAVLHSRLQDAYGIDFKVRVAIHSGDAIVSRAVNKAENVTDPLNDYIASGDTVNLVSRLQRAAKPGGIIMTRPAYQLARRVIEVRGPTDITLPEQETTLSTYELVGLLTQPRVIHGTVTLAAPLVGRKREWAQLQEAFAVMRHGVGGVVCVIGDAGLGKSRLIAEWRRTNEQRRTTAALGNLSPRQPQPESRSLWLDGRCAADLTTVSYAPWRDLLRRAIQLLPQATPTQTWDLLSARLQTWLPQRHEQVLPHLAQLLGAQAPERVTPLAYLDAESVQQQMFAAMRDWATALAQTHPVVCYFHDLHWADEPSLSLLEAILPVTLQVPLMVLCALRPDRAHGSWRFKEAATRRLALPQTQRLPMPSPDDKARARYTEIVLSPLTAEATAQLLDYFAAAHELSAQTRAHITARAEGNPLYIEEVVRSLSESPPSGTPSRVNLPSTVHGVLAARLDRLPIGSKNLLQVASVIGRTVDLTVLAAVLSETTEVEPSHIDTTWLQPYLAPLQAAEMVQLDLQSQHLTFKQALLQEAAYHSLLQTTRRQHHQKVAQTLERLRAQGQPIAAGAIGAHYAEAQQPHQAIPYWMEAGDAAERRYDNHEAVMYYTRALELLDAPGGINLAPLNDQPARDWMMKQSAHVTIKLGNIHARLGELKKAQAYYQRTLTLWDQQGQRAQLAHIYYELADLTPSPSESIKLLRQGIAAIMPNENAPPTTQAENESLAWGYRLLGEKLYNHYGAIKAALELWDKAIALCERIGYLEEWGACYHQLALLHSHQGNYAEAIHCGQRAIDKFVEAQKPARAAQSYNNQAMLHMLNGDWDKARAYASQGLVLAEQTGAAMPQGYLLTTLGELHIHRGEWDAAEQILRKGLELARRVDEPWLNAECLRDLGLIALGRSRYAEATDFFMQALAIGEQTRTSRVPQFLLDLAEAQIALKHWTEAHQLIEQVITSAQPLKQQVIIAAAQRLRAQLRAAQANYEQAISDLESSLVTLRQLRNELEVAHTLYAYGQLLLQRGELGDHEKAYQRLTAALAIYQRLKAMVGVEKTQRALGIAQ
jgi:predicted ATPase/class 3 adenylate cyclase